MSAVDAFDGSEHWEIPLLATKFDVALGNTERDEWRRGEIELEIRTFGRISGRVSVRVSVRASVRASVRKGVSR